jgi:hypothetical protein
MGMTTHEYMWIFTRSAIENKFYTNYQYKHFPIGSLGLEGFFLVKQLKFKMKLFLILYLFEAVWYNTSADWACKNILSDSFRIWANTVDRYYQTAKRDNLTLMNILPNTKCWNRVENIKNPDLKYHYGKNIHQ